jgi:predicted ATP-grasp superfamily ATP-dependent carboligase
LRLFIYEYITGGGLFGASGDDLDSLRREGEAMVTVIAHQFAQVAGVQVDLLWDARLPEPSLPARLHRVASAEVETAALAAIASDADGTIVIAPEIDGILLHRARVVENTGGRLFSPSSNVIAIASDKRQTTTRLRATGIPAPHCVELRADDRSVAILPREFRFPAVLKRIDGAGSLGMRRVDDAGAAIQLGSGRWMLEESVPGVAASAAVLCGPNGHVVLPAFLQQLDAETFSYTGGSRLQGTGLQIRMRHLAARAIEILPDPVGFIGVDMVLGDDESGKHDAVIEINPRLTTSIVGLCAIARTNLADAMLAVARGGIVDLEFSDDDVSFTSDGIVTRSSSVECCTA